MLIRFVLTDAAKMLLNVLIEVARAFVSAILDLTHYGRVAQKKKGEAWKE
jgi:hypothetical protein